MKTRMKQIAGMMLFLLPICFSPFPSLAQDTNGQSIQRITPNGYFNWATGTVTATGFGVPPKSSMSAAQAREMTRAAAWSVALANLLEVVNGIQVDAQTTVQNYVTTSAEIQTHVEGMVKQATVIEERELPTGEFRTTVRMQIAGPITERVSSSEAMQVVTSTPSDPPSNPVKKNSSSKPRVSQPKPPPRPQSSYTGLLIDARNIGAKPALTPKILAQDDVIYGPTIVDKKFITGPSVPKEDQNRIAWYFTDEATARKHEKVTPKPLVIKAVRAIGATKTDLVIEETKAQRIQSLPEYLTLFKQAKVVIIIDPDN